MEFCSFSPELFQKEKGGDTLAAAWKVVRAKVTNEACLAILGPLGDALSVQLLSQCWRGAPFGEYSGRPDFFVSQGCGRLCTAYSRGGGFRTRCLRQWHPGSPPLWGGWQGITDYLVGGNRGFLVDPEDSGALADAMLDIIGHQELAEQRGRSARNWVKNTASTEKVVARHMETYMALLSKKAQ